MPSAASLVLRRARRQARLSQRGLAQRVGLQQSAIARWERGGVVPSYDTVLRLVRACGWDLDLCRPPLTAGQIEKAVAGFARSREREETELAFLAARKAGSTQTYKEFAREYRARKKG